MSVCLDLKTDSCYAMLWVELCPPLTANVMVLGSRPFGMYPGWHGILMVVPHDGISLSFFFSLLFSLFFLPFNHHMWEHRKKRKIYASQECLHWELNWPSPWSCIVSGLWQPVGLRGYFCTYWCQMMKYRVHETLLSYICFVWNCFAVRGLWKVHFEGSVLVIPWGAQEYRFRQVQMNEWLEDHMLLTPTHLLASENCSP